MGIETIYSTYTPSDERHIKALAKKYAIDSEVVEEVSVLEESENITEA